ncbi:MAG: hypothetical protein RJA37_366 [Verrucomicrobiota bacterium]|jgi:NADH-quinone oxidoreductase subunit M
MEGLPAQLLKAVVAAPVVTGLLLIAGRRLPRSLGSWIAFAGFAVPAALAPWLLLVWSDLSVPPAAFRGEGLWGFGLSLNGFGAPLLAMTSLVGLAAGIKALNQDVESRHAYLGLLLFMLGGTLGVFATDHVVGFYFFHEFALIPTFVLTLFWGGEGRRPAAMQMAIYLTVGAMASLAGILMAVDAAGLEWTKATFEGVADGLLSKGAPQGAGALALFGFGTLASLFPFHSWAAPGYSAAPTPAAMLHAGALKKFGLYGLALLGLTSLRVTEGALGGWLLWFALGNVVLIGLVCLTQVDLKRLASWSSVAHMGPVFLGLWVAGTRGSAAGLDAAVLLMTAHGLSCAALFLLSNDVRVRTGSYRFEDMGGLASRAPVLGAFFIAASMASLGLPGFGNFWGEIGVFLSLRAEPLWLQALAASTVVITAVYTLRAAAAVFFGPASAALEARAAAAPFGDISWPSRLAAGLLLAASMAVGFQPSLVTDSINRVSADVVKYVRPVPQTPSAR